MQPKREFRHVGRLVIAFVLMAAFLSASAAWAADDLVKQAEKKLSGIKRNTVTNPNQAEKDWLEVKDILAKLKASGEAGDKLPTLEKSHETLGQVLEKRLGRPLGGAAAETSEAKDNAKEKKAQEKKQESPASDLPSSVTSRLDKINTSLDAVEQNIEKHRLETAKRKLSDATKVMDEIQKRYAAKIPADNEQMKAATTRLETVTAAYSQAQKVADEKAAAEAAVKEARESQSKEWIDKINPFFDPKSDLYLRIGSSFNSGTEEEQKLYRKAYDQANALMAEYQKVEFPNGKTLELDYLEYRLGDYLFDYNEGEKRAKQAEACKEWIDKLRQYVDVGAGSRKYLIASATLGEDEINQRQALFDEAKDVWAEYQKADFPLGKTDRLVGLEKDMQQRLAEMPEALRQSRALVSGEIEKEFDRILNYLNVDTGWKSDQTKSPNIAMERDLKPLRQGLERYAGTVDANDAKLAALREKMAKIEETDQANRATCAERTFMLPWKYDGSDGEALEEKAESIVKEKISGAKPLRVTLPAENWKEEKVLEWTDTTQSAVRYRVTRFMTAQVAAKDNDGKVYLHSVHLAADRTSEGSWGPLYGHIMWSDWMAEENVNKKPPKP